MKIDMWYGNKEQEVTGAWWCFYPNDGVYRGNLLIGDKFVGDFVADDSCEIQDRFPFVTFD